MTVQKVWVFFLILVHTVQFPVVLLRLVTYYQITTNFEAMWISNTRFWLRTNHVCVLLPVWWHAAHARWHASLRTSCPLTKFPLFAPSRRDGYVVVKENTPSKRDGNTIKHDISTERDLRRRCTETKDVFDEDFGLSLCIPPHVRFHRMVAGERCLTVDDKLSTSNMKEMIGGCCVCSDERGWAENPLVYCDGHGCNVAVHQGKLHATLRMRLST